MNPACRGTIAPASVCATGYEFLTRCSTTRPGSPSSPWGFCYPGIDAKGGDRPPRPECAPLWHPPLRAALPDVELTLLVGMYAQAHYLGKRRRKTLTETVRHWRDYLPEFLPLPHPSWRNTAWLKKNPWFEEDLLPALRKRVQKLAAQPLRVTR
jgi:uracil-DNA glycosylase